MQLEKELDALFSKQKSTKQQENNTLAILKNIDKKIGLLAEKLLINAKQVDQSQALLNNLKKEEDLLQKEASTQTALLEKHLMSAYEMGRYPLIKVFLNEENPQVMDRLASYYSYLNKARLDVIIALQKNQTRLTKLKETREAELKTLRALQEQELTEQTELKKEQNKQSALANRLRQSILTQNSQIAFTQKSKRALEKILSQTPQNAYPRPQAPFSRMQYKLTWPTKGLLSDLYGKTITGTSLKHSGVEILAPENQPIVAVYPGVVVFSDWLRGFGLITIIDHGLGFMTLYAHNQSLLKRQGEQVSMGEEIATVGHTGGQQENGVYFEIRKNGRPVDPLRWLLPEKLS
jgi:septal ring factor EnvC (AmiA/AmiB activator)